MANQGIDESGLGELGSLDEIYESRIASYLDRDDITPEVSATLAALDIRGIVEAGGVEDFLTKQIAVINDTIKALPERMQAHYQSEHVDKLRILEVTLDFVRGAKGGHK